MEKKYPKTVGIIMDGNRRWARERGLSSYSGHDKGYSKLKEVWRWANEFGIATLYVYTFSTENWNRSKEEVGYLMKLFLRMIVKDFKVLTKENIKIRFIGQIERFSLPIRKGIDKLEKATEKFSGGNFVVCLSYGGRAEIVETVKKINDQLSHKQIAVLSEEQFSRYLWTAGLPDPELVIRTSGEIRTSNFLPWQTAYSEWFFTKTYWPAFTKSEFEAILNDFSERDIRRGK